MNSISSDWPGEGTMGYGEYVAYIKTTKGRTLKIDSHRWECSVENWEGMTWGITVN